jgi:hypothetical protein
MSSAPGQPDEGGYARPDSGNCGWLGDYPILPRKAVALVQIEVSQVPKSAVHSRLALGRDRVPIQGEDEQVVEAAHAAKGLEDAIERSGITRVQFALAPLGPQQPMRFVVFTE